MSPEKVGLREIESTLPPGFRFYPGDEELVCHYLHRKVSRQVQREEEDGITMVEVDLHTREPWELPDAARLNANQWYFFSFRDRKYATGSRTNRATKSGYWKATGKDRTVCDPRTRAMAGMRKTLVFYRGRAPNGIKTPWIMHEFRIETPHSPAKEDWVLCRVFHKRKGEDGAGDDSNNNHVSSSSSSHAADKPAAMAGAAAAAGCQQLLLSPSLMEPSSSYNSISSSIPPLMDMQALLQYSGLVHHDSVAAPGSAVQDMAAMAGTMRSCEEDQLSSWMEMMAEQLPRWQ